MKERKVKEALSLFEVMSEAYPERWRPWFYQGEVYRMVGQPKKALEFYKIALSKDENNEEVKAKIASINN